MKIKPGDLVTAVDDSSHVGVVLTIRSAKKRKGRMNSEDYFHLKFPIIVLWDTGQRIEENEKTICVIS